MHLTAIAGRLGIRIPSERFNEISDETPVLVDLKPVGEGYMEDFHAAGGMGALLRELRPLLHLGTVDVEGRTLAERLDEPPGWVDRSVIRAFDNPVSPEGGLVALSGNLAPDGAIFKRAAATPELFESRGGAVVFTGLEDLSRGSTTRTSTWPRATCWCFRMPGRTPPGCRKRATCPFPKNSPGRGVKDMVRISDARCRRTAFGSIVLHIARRPPSGARSAPVRDGDRIRLSIGTSGSTCWWTRPRSPRLADHEPPPAPKRGYKALYRRTVTQAAGTAATSTS